MKIVKEAEAGELFCPIRGKVEGDDELRCDGAVCMAWQESVMEDGKGFCALIYKPEVNQKSIMRVTSEKPTEA